MPRAPRLVPGGYVYHVLNRASQRRTIFLTSADYDDFETLLFEARERVSMRLLAYCVMPNHWHLVLWPHGDGDVSSFVQWLASAHANRWHAFHGTQGSGHVYQGRFKSFPVRDGEHFFRVSRYVERNALRAGLVRRAEDWEWGSLRRRASGISPRLDDGPEPLPVDWVERVNQPETRAELDELRTTVSRGSPYGDAEWQETTAQRLGLVASLRERGRPKKRA